MANRERLTILINARSTRYDGSLGDSIESLRDRLDVQVVEVDDPTTFSDRLRNAAKDADLIAIASGDGTLARSADVLREIGRPIGVIPLGNANDLARGLGVPLDPAQACLAIAGAEPIRVDLGRVNGHAFFSAATFGIGARISSEMDPGSKRRWRRLSQIPRLLAAIRGRRSFSLDVEIDGRAAQRLRSLHVTIGSGRTIGGGIVIDEAARLDDARLKFSSVQPQTFGALLRMIPAYVTGRRRAHPRIDTFWARRIRIVTPEPMAIATDGDVVTETPADFECLAGAIEFLVPRDPQGQHAIGASAGRTS